MFARILRAAFVLMAGLGSAEAGGGDRIKGLIVDRCADCHIVAGYADKAADVGAPSLAAIAADQQTYPDARIRASLKKPHWPMTQFVLSMRDIDSLVAYFDDLRAVR